MTISLGDSHFGDPDFVYGRAMSQTAGTAMIRVADADVLPFQFGDFADTLRNYVQELKKLATDQRTQMAEINREIDEGAFKAAADPHVKSVAPEKQALPPTFDFAPLDNAVIALAKSAQDYDQSRAKGATTNVKSSECFTDPERTRFTGFSAGLPGGGPGSSIRSMRPAFIPATG